LKDVSEGRVVNYIFKNVEFIGSTVEDMVEAALAKVAMIIYTGHVYILTQGYEPCKGGI